MAFDENTANPEALAAQLAVFDLAVSKVEAKAVKALQGIGQDARLDVAKSFAAEKYHTDSGAKKKLGSISNSWRSTKKRFGYDSRLGHATGGIQKVFDSKSAVKKTPKGFILDFEGVAAGKTTKYRTRAIGAKPRKKGAPLYRKRNVGKYLDKYAARKAPSLGALSKSFRKRMAKTLDDAVGEDLKRLTKSAQAGSLATGGFVFQMRIDTFGLGAA